MRGRAVTGRRSALRILGHDHGRPAIAVLMACLTFLGAGVAALQSAASIESGRFGRAADTAAMRQIGLDAQSQVGSLRDNAAFRQWFAVLQEAAWAREPASSSDPTEVEERAALAEIDGALADWIRERSRLLQPPYFDATTYLVDFNAYAADLGRAARLSTERAAAASRSSDAWGRKANSYVTILTMLAVAVFFLGLAGTVAVRARAILIAAGGVLGGAALAATVALAVGPVVGVPEAAIDALVDAQVAVERAGSGDAIYLTDATREVYGVAIRNAATAVALDPAGVSAQRTAANANLSFANARIFAAEGPSAETDDLLRTSIAAFEAAIALDPDDPSSWWDLGFARYLVGDLDGSIAATQEVIKRSPTQYVPYVNRAVAEAAAGRPDVADRSVAEAIAVSASTNLATNGAFFGRVDADLTRLANLRPAEAAWLIATQRRLREANVAIRVLGRSAADAGLPPSTHRPPRAAPRVQTARSRPAPRSATGRRSSGRASMACA